MDIKLNPPATTDQTMGGRVKTHQQIVRCSKPRRSLEQTINETSDSYPRWLQQKLFHIKFGYDHPPPQTPPSHQPVLIIGKDISKLSFHRFPIGEINSPASLEPLRLLRFEFFLRQQKTPRFFKGHWPFHMATHSGWCGQCGHNHVSLFTAL